MGDGLLAAGLFVATTLGSLGVVVAWVLVLPVDRFSSTGDRGVRAGGLGRRIGRNLLGLLLIAVGAVLAIPGVPGQGVLTMLVGLLLVDLPGRERLARRVVRRPAVFRGMNAIRRRFGKEPMEPPR